MFEWIALHWTEVGLHLGLDLSGGLTLRCAMGMCQHRSHQMIVWGLGAIFLSITTVWLVG